MKSEADHQFFPPSIGTFSQYSLTALKVPSCFVQPEKELIFNYLNKIR